MYLGSLMSVAAEQQVLNLKPGWNSVFLELEPDEVSPEVLFAGKPIEMVTLWIPTAGKVLSLTDPSAEVGKSAEWHTWQPASSPSAFLNNLQALPSRAALLVKATSACEVTITGRPVFERVEWRGASFNFVGFDIDSAAPPTFGRFFDGSRAHEDLKIFRLLGNQWRKVRATDVMERGEAYWVWCREGSDFQGPLEVSLPGGELGFQREAGEQGFSVKVHGTLPLTLEAQLPSGYAGSVALRGEPAASQSVSTVFPAGTTEVLEVVSEAQSDSYSGSLRLRGGGLLYRLPLVVR